ncbi:MAG: hypothetical protein KHZ90_08415 [Veillonella parvula]|uniref:Uncharacterized protein n=1 Tax=Veillonella parvula TaxID=29466 RepID=A0A943A469_VEIPA|nr:hypothetical protein [Veillonella parvula]EGT3606774.1 hypothetical protein [Clostridium perfringens]MBS4893784.1 hypothetical protein [Veillonella parvula]
MDGKDEFDNEVFNICEKYIDEDELALVGISYDYLGEIKDILYKNNIEMYEKYKNKGIYNVDYTDNLEKYKDQLDMMGED